MRTIASLLGLLLAGALAYADPAPTSTQATFDSIDRNADRRISRTEAATLPWLATSFDQIDKNRDGYLVRSELRAHHEQVAQQRKAEHAQRAQERFAAADLNRDGKLSRVEVSEKMPRLAKSFAFLDEDRDGYLTRADLEFDRH